MAFEPKAGNIVRFDDSFSEGYAHLLRRTTCRSCGSVISPQEKACGFCGLAVALDEQEASLSYAAVKPLINEQRATVLRRLMLDNADAYCDLHRFHHLLLSYYPEEMLTRSMLFMSLRGRVPQRLLRQKRIDASGIARLAQYLTKGYGIECRQAVALVCEWALALGLSLENLCVAQLQECISHKEEALATEIKKAELSGQGLKSEHTGGGGGLYAEEYFQRGLHQPLYRRYQWLHRAGCLGHTAAQVAIGDLFSVPGPNQDLEVALKWYRLSAEKCYPGASYQLGMCYRLGIGVLQEDAEANKWLSEATKLGSLGEVGVLNLSIAQDSDVSVYDLESASDLRSYFENGDLFERLTQEAGQGVVPAIAMLGVCWEKGLGCSRNEEQAAACYFRAAQAHHAGAQYHYALLCLEGRGTALKPSSAYYWLEQAGLQGHLKAQVLLGDCCLSGRGGTLDPGKAIRLFEHAAKMGEPLGALRLAHCRLSGQNVRKNELQAFNYYLKAATYGEPEAQYYLAFCYSLGIGVHRNDRTALSWRLRAAGQGHREALLEVAIVFFEGKIVSQDNLRAFYLLLQAAKKQHPKAALMIGDCFFRGTACEVDKEQAKLWWQRAGELGNHEAKLQLEAWFAQEQPNNMTTE